MSIQDISSADRYENIAQAIHEFSGISTGYELFKILKQIKELYEYTYFAMLRFQSGDGGKVILSNWEPEFLSECIDSEVFTNSPIFSAGGTSLLPSIGRLDSGVFTGGPSPARAAHAMLSENGHVSFAYFPVLTHGRLFLVLGFSGTRQIPTLREQMELHYVSQHACATFPKIQPDGIVRENPLSDRERFCLRAAADGFSNGEIARQLQISEHTIAYHLSSAIRKLDCRNKAHAVAEAFRRGWIE